MLLTVTAVNCLFIIIKEDKPFMKRIQCHVGLNNLPVPLCPLPSPCLHGGTWGGQGEAGTIAGITHWLSFLQDLLSYYTTTQTTHAVFSLQILRNF